MDFGLRLLPSCPGQEKKMRFGNIMPDARGAAALCVGICALTAPLQALAQDAAWPASPDDCAVMAEVGKAKFHWGGAKSDTPLGARSFGLDCDWKGLGIKGVTIAPPDPGSYYDGLRLSFQRPVYVAGGQRAAITFGVSGSKGPKTYFSTGSTCTVEKHNGQWQFVSCQMRWIT